MHRDQRTYEDFDTFYTTMRARYVTLANSYIEDRAAAEDIVADSFIVCWLKRDSIADADQRRYITGTIKKKCLEYLRNKQNRLRIQHEIYDENWRMVNYHISSLEQAESETALTSEVLQIYSRTLDSMRELTRAVFLASRLEDLSYKEIADRYQISVRRVTSEIQRSLAMFRTALKDYLP